MPAGRPTKYRTEFAEQAAKLCKLGATDADMAMFFEVDESTIREWKLRHEEFSLSIKLSKDETDARVEQSLYRRAMGYSHPAVKIMQADGVVLQHPYVEHYPPDTTACIFWLKNRQPKEWRDRIEAELNGSLTVTVKRYGGS